MPDGIDGLCCGTPWKSKGLTKGYETMTDKVAEWAVAATDKARQQPGAAQAMGALMVAEQALGGQLGRLMALAEAYPELKADRNMREFAEELTSTENRVGFARQAYNDAVLQYNDAAMQFPASLVAGMFSFREATMLQSTQSADERSAPPVRF